jgi:hypothetical protein
MCEPDDADMYELSDVEPLIYDLCRICALPNDELVSIFGEEGIRRQLQQKINYCLPVQVNLLVIIISINVFYYIQDCFYIRWKPRIFCRSLFVTSVLNSWSKVINWPAYAWKLNKPLRRNMRNW